MKKRMYEIVFHGRAGQGAKSAAHIIAKSAMHVGKYIQAFPEYGAAREGAPMRVFLRIDEKPIRRVTPIEHPNNIVIFDYSLVPVKSMYKGLSDDGIIIANAPEEPSEIKGFVMEVNPDFHGKMYWLNATKLSFDEVGSNVTNTAMLGAFARTEDLVNIDAIKHIFREKFEHKLNEDLLHKNLVLMEKAYHECKEF